MEVHVKAEVFVSQPVVLTVRVCNFGLLWSCAVFCDLLLACHHLLQGRGTAPSGTPDAMRLGQRTAGQRYAPPSSHGRPTDPPSPQQGTIPQYFATRDLYCGKEAN